MWRWVFPFLLILGAACSAGTPQTSSTPPIPSTQTVDASARGIQPVVRQELEHGNGGYYMLRFDTPLDDKTRLELEQSKVQLKDKIDEDAYTAYLEEDSLPVLEKLVDAGDLSYVGAIPPEAKLQPELAAKIQADPQAEYEVVVQLFTKPPEQTLKDLNRWMQVSGTSFGPVNIVEGKVKGSDVSNILALPLVKRVEERIPADLGGG